MCSIPPPLAPRMSARGLGTLQGTLPDGAPVYCHEDDGCPTYPIIPIPPIIEINPEAIKLPPAMQDEDQEAFSRVFSISDKATAFHAEPTTTYNKDDGILSLIKAQPSTLGIPSISITLTKPGDPWSTSSDPREGSAFPWFTDWTAASLVTTTTAKETTIAEATMPTSTSSEKSSSTVPEDTPSPAPSKKKRVSGGQMAAIVIGLIGGIGLLLLAFFAAVKFRHKLIRSRKPKTVYTTMNRASTVPGRTSPSYFDTASTPDVSRNVLSAMPNVFGRWRNNSPPEYSRPEVQSPEQSMYHAHIAGARTESSSVYSQNSHLDRPPAIPRPYGNYV
ncbi:hypothetical protein FGRMN_6384 [Fusarium graminum]|nr:hypothetical protein FGRMN_6384 [Fusarium graminum]